MVHCFVVHIEHSVRLKLSLIVESITPVLPITILSLVSFISIF